MLAPVLSGLRGQVIVATVPWEWPAVARCKGVRRVFDCADDWCEVMPHRRTHLRALYDRVAAEADTIICASESLAERFAPRQVTVVRNGTPASLLVTQPVPAPGTSTMVYAGTMSERFDAPLVAAVLERLPEWRLDLYGQCQYAGHADEPDPELTGLLSGGPGVPCGTGRSSASNSQSASTPETCSSSPTGAWCGRRRRYEVLRLRRSRKACDDDRLDRSPRYIRAAAHEDRGHACRLRRGRARAAEESSDLLAARRSWAEANSWQARWPAWSGAVFG